jgi:hypothetical protein
MDCLKSSTLASAWSVERQDGIADVFHDTVGLVAHDQAHERAVSGSKVATDNRGTAQETSVMSYVSLDGRLGLESSYDCSRGRTTAVGRALA